jgi:CheY-like chemotaxis protein
VDPIQKLIQAIASLLWPVIVIILVLRFRPAITAIVESAKSRKFTLKIGGQELTMEEANQAQQKLIADLQSQVSDIQKKLDGATPTHPFTYSTNPAVRSQSIKTILWVDDNPKNVSYFIEHLSELGIRVDMAESTSEGSARFEAKKYDCVMSDMGRKEQVIYNSTAGLDLLKIVRAKDAIIPFVFFTSQQAIDSYGQQALNLGATGMTSSPTRLFGILNVG